MNEYYAIDPNWSGWKNYGYDRNYEICIRDIRDIDDVFGMFRSMVYELNEVASKQRIIVNSASTVKLKTKSNILRLLYV